MDEKTQRRPLPIHYRHHTSAQLRPAYSERGSSKPYLRNLHAAPPCGSILLPENGTQSSTESLGKNHSSPQPAGRSMKQSLRTAKCTMQFIISLSDDAADPSPLLSRPPPSPRQLHKQRTWSITARKHQNRLKRIDWPLPRKR